MSQSQNPMTGNMKGSMGNFVTTSRAGDNYVRIKAFNPKDANSPAQQLHRKSFKLTVEEYQTFGGIIDEGFPEKQSGQSSYNLFIAANLQEAIDKSGAEPVIDYSKLLVANGSLPQAMVTGATITTDGISIGYQSNIKVPKVNSTDVMVAVVKTQIGELLFEKQPRGEDKTGTILLDYPGIQISDVKCCYLFVLNSDGNKASKSVFIPLV